MAKSVVIDGISDKNIADAVKELRQYAVWVEKKEAELRSRLASLGATVASIHFSRAVYNGTNDVSVRVDDTGSVAVIYAEGESVAFIEFGSGERYGYGHPWANIFGFGPGTWSEESDEGKGHWNDPDGWWYAHGEHSYGNPPAMAMYEAVQAITEEFTKIAREVFAS
jgi:hypothetical protein